jgi:hypothetical protein
MGRVQAMMGTTGHGAMRRARVLWLCAALAMQGCGLPFSEPFIHPYDKVSGSRGTIWFVIALQQRNCSWFECGESSTRVLGATLTAYRLQRGRDGRFTFTQVARLACSEDNTAACDIAATSPQLRRVGGRLAIDNSGRGLVPATIAWSDMRDFPLARGTWLCTAASLPQGAAARVLKVAPNAGLTGAGQVLYALPHAPQPADARA